MKIYSQPCHPERRISAAARTIFVVEGPAACLQQQSCRQHSRSLHARIDRQSRSIHLVGMTVFGWWLIAAICNSCAFAADSLSIKLSHYTPREIQTAQLLQKVVSSYDLKKYTY